MTYVIFVLLMSGIGSALVASNKGRNSFGWFLIGFLIGPMGFILSLIISKNTKVLEENAIQNSELKICPYCAELIKYQAKICKHCGRDFSEIALSTLPLDIPENQSPEKKVRTPTIHDAIWWGDRAKVNEFINSGADLNAVNEKGKTPLALAIARNDKLLITLLRANGAK